MPTKRAPSDRVVRAWQLYERLMRVIETTDLLDARGALKHDALAGRLSRTILGMMPREADQYYRGVMKRRKARG